MRLPLVARGIDGSRVVVSSTSRRLGSVRSGSFCSAQVGRPLVHGLTRHELTEVATRKQPQQAESSPKQRYADPSGDPLVTVSDRVDRTPCRHWIRHVGGQQTSRRGRAAAGEFSSPDTEARSCRALRAQGVGGVASGRHTICGGPLQPAASDPVDEVVHPIGGPYIVRSVTFWPRAERGQSPVGATSRGRPR